MKRFIKTLLFYFRMVGIKNTLLYELPEFRKQAHFYNVTLTDVMEEAKSDYVG